ncbi:MAG: site-specific integrase [Rubrivivax sp.]|nr:site-specific integrase [Rubrivivax sp.]
MGSITKSTRTDAATGKPVKVFRAYVRRQGYASKSKVCATAREAKEWLRENDGSANLQRVTSGKTLNKLIDEFVEAPPTKGTRYWQPAPLEFWREQLGAMKVVDISRGDINAAKSALQARPAMCSTPSGPKLTDRKLTAGSINRYLSTLSSVFNFALDRELIETHPMKGGKVQKLTENTGRRRILTADEQDALLKAAKASEWPMLHLFVRMCLTTAGRRGEVLNLRWSDVSIEDSIAVLHVTKNGRARALPLVADVKVALLEAKKVRPLASDFVFFDPKHPERPKNVKTVWTACRKTAGLLNDREDPLDRVYLHSTRHTAVTRMLKGGANLAQAAAVSGHQTLAMLKRYEHLAAADSVELAERLLAGK